MVWIMLKAWFLIVESKFLCNDLLVWFVLIYVCYIITYVMDFLWWLSLYYWNDYDRLLLRVWKSLNQLFILSYIYPKLKDDFRLLVWSCSHSGLNLNLIILLSDYVLIMYLVLTTFLAKLKHGNTGIVWIYLSMNIFLGYRIWFQQHNPHVASGAGLYSQKHN